MSLFTWKQKTIVNVSVNHNLQAVKTISVNKKRHCKLFGSISSVFAWYGTDKRSKYIENDICLGFMVAPLSDAENPPTELMALCKTKLSTKRKLDAFSKQRAKFLSNAYM